MNEKSLPRRAFLGMVAALGASGVLAWVSSGSVEAAKDTPIIGVDAAEVGGGEPVAFLIITGPPYQPFAPYHLDPDSDMGKVDRFREFDNRAD